MRSQQALADEADLVCRCVAGDDDAWRALYDSHHHGLRSAVAHLLGPAQRNALLVEELAASVWSSLVWKNNHRLRAYEPGRGSFATYLGALARQEFCRFLRRQVQQRRCLRPWPAAEPAAKASGVFPTGLLWKEFLEALTSRERQYVLHCLAAPSPDGVQFIASSANQRKLKQRVCDKLLAFIAN